MFLSFLRLCQLLLGGEVRPAGRLSGRRPPRARRPPCTWRQRFRPAFSSTSKSPHSGVSPDGSCRWHQRMANDTWAPGLRAPGFGACGLRAARLRSTVCRSLKPGARQPDSVSSIEIFYLTRKHQRCINSAFQSHDNRFRRCPGEFPSIGGSPMLSRRDLLKLGLAGTPYILLPHDRAYAQVPPSFVDDGFQSPPTTPWLAELPIPGPPIEVPPYALPAGLRQIRRWREHAVLRHLRRGAHRPIPSPVAGDGDLGLSRPEPCRRSRVRAWSDVQFAIWPAPPRIWQGEDLGTGDGAASQQPAGGPHRLRKPSHVGSSPRCAPDATCGWVPG